MKLILSIPAAVLILTTSFCAKLPVKQSNKTVPVSTPESSNQINCDWKDDVLGDKNSALQKFLVGKWEGRYVPDQGIEMYLIFQDNGIAIIDYSQIERRNNPRGKAFYRPYRINADNTLSICGYPDNFTVKQHSKNEFSLISDNKEIYWQESIEIIYECRFRRAK